MKTVVFNAFGIGDFADDPQFGTVTLTDETIERLKKAAAAVTTGDLNVGVIDSGACLFGIPPLVDEDSTAFEDEHRIVNGEVWIMSYGAGNDLRVFWKGSEKHGNESYETSSVDLGPLLAALDAAADGDTIYIRDGSVDPSLAHEVAEARAEATMPAEAF